MTDERQLAEAWARGDTRAGRALVASTYDAIVRFFRTKAGPEADDLVQRTFLVCSERVGTFSGDAPFRAFLFGIARNVLLEHYRSRTRDDRNVPDFHERSIADLQPGVWSQVARRDDERNLLRALQLLPLESQILLELFYWEEVPIADLAVILEVAPGTIKSRLHRAREALQDAFAHLPEQPVDPRTARVLLASWRKRTAAAHEAAREPTNR
ncbi:MAG: sigma-70 family RNA polymerase sigma factor [Myxococcales bacterium]|nr:sigma-70 family RNA polymerase sigma factor [Myxococcales bacterium]